ncbi:hypothetical protein F8388_004171 [Cannabis sativa]|uniref:Zinc knuckle CX2CX4HX4C domain-containing protein n=1 Tax=Cannabis sativa TaxID=3483 RepID=A0A7J6E902_CANSA|nr:hypothetical protein F8388_004171 [Cannabis sativa]
MAEWAGNIVGTYIDVHEDSLNEGWGPFLRFRASIDISKPLLRGKMVKLRDSREEFWVEFRYERLPEFCFECGTIGHPFEHCHSFLEKLYTGVEPSMSYGPEMIGSPLPQSGYDRYRTDFFKGEVWPLMTRLAKKSITAVLPQVSSRPQSFPAVLTIGESSQQAIPKHNLHSANESTPTAPNLHTNSITTSANHNDTITLPIPSYLQSSFPFATYPPSSSTINITPSTDHSPTSFNSALYTTPAATPTLPTNTVKNHQPQRDNGKGKSIAIANEDKENCNPNKMFKRQLNAESLRSVLKRCRSNDPSTRSGADPNLMVADLITEQRQWDLISLRANFSQPDVDRILSIPLSLFPHDDAMIWSHSFTGIYNVKSGYQLAVSYAEQDDTASSHSMENWWSTFWKMKLPPKAVASYAPSYLAEFQNARAKHDDMGCSVNGVTFGDSGKRIS